MSNDTPNVPARPVLPTEGSTNVSLREFEQRMFSFEQRMNDRIRSERELIEARSSALEYLLEARSAALSKAHILQAEEYARRLSELNHAHEINKENWAKSLSREMWYQWEKDYDKWREGVQEQLTTLAQMPEPSVLAAWSNIPGKIDTLFSRVDTLNQTVQQATGALVLIRFMGVAGVIALIVTFLRMANVIP